MKSKIFLKFLCFQGEMWVGVCLSVMVELVPEKLRTTGVGLYFFIISNIGGNMQVIVPPIQQFIQDIFKLNKIQAFRGKNQGKKSHLSYPIFSFNLRKILK